MPLHTTAFPKELRHGWNFRFGFKKGDCAKSLDYGVDYHCHLGTDYAGMAIFGENGIERKIHDIRGENFRPKFQQDYDKMKGKYGIGVIGYDIQPILPPAVTACFHSS